MKARPSARYVERHFNVVAGVIIAHLEILLGGVALSDHHAQTARLENEARFRALGVSTDPDLAFSISARDTQPATYESRSSSATTAANSKIEDIRAVNMTLAGMRGADSAIPTLCHKLPLVGRNPLRSPPVRCATLNAPGRSQRLAPKKSFIAAVDLQVGDVGRRGRGVVSLLDGNNSAGEPGVGCSSRTHCSLTLDPADNASHP
jgi:hypothetical protein